jgi:hypothetical protein
MGPIRSRSAENRLRPTHGVKPATARPSGKPFLAGVFVALGGWRPV